MHRGLSVECQKLAIVVFACPPQLGLTVEAPMPARCRTASSPLRAAISARAAHSGLHVCQTLGTAKRSLRKPLSVRKTIAQDVRTPFHTARHTPVLSNVYIPAEGRSFPYRPLSISSLALNAATACASSLICFVLPLLANTRPHERIKRVQRVGPRAFPSACG